MAPSRRPISTALPMSSAAASGSTANSSTSFRLQAPWIACSTAHAQEGYTSPTASFCCWRSRVHASILLTTTAGRALLLTGAPARMTRRSGSCIHRSQAFFQLYHHNLVVSRDGNISVQPKPIPAYRLESFGDYLGRTEPHPAVRSRELRGFGAIRHARRVLHDFHRLRLHGRVCPRERHWRHEMFQ